MRRKVLNRPPMQIEAIGRDRGDYRWKGRGEETEVRRRRRLGSNKLKSQLGG